MVDDAIERLQDFAFPAPGNGRQIIPRDELIRMLDIVPKKPPPPQWAA